MMNPKIQALVKSYYWDELKAEVKRRIEIHFSSESYSRGLTPEEAYSEYKRKEGLLEAYNILKEIEDDIIKANLINNE